VFTELHPGYHAYSLLGLAMTHFIVEQVKLYVRNPTFSLWFAHVGNLKNMLVSFLLLAGPAVPAGTRQAYVLLLLLFLG